MQTKAPSAIAKANVFGALCLLMDRYKIIHLPDEAEISRLITAT